MPLDQGRLDDVQLVHALQTGTLKEHAQIVQAVRRTEAQTIDPDTSATRLGGRINDHTTLGHALSLARSGAACIRSDHRSDAGRATATSKMAS